MAWREFRQLAADELYELLAVRQRVLVVEQASPYADLDGLDKRAWHLLARRADGTVVGCLRLLDPGVDGADVGFGRVVTLPSERGQGLGRRLVTEAVRFAAQRWPGLPVVIHAQAYLEEFYKSHGFVTLGEPFDDVGVLHRTMRREPPR